MYIYGLFSPDGELRYVGKTSKVLKKRLWEHTAVSQLKYACHRTNWIKSLYPQKPYIQLIQTLSSEKELNEAEIYWISYFRSVGCRLVNSTDGGEGVRGRKHTEESKAYLRSINIGKKMSPEACAKISKVHKGKVVSIEARKKMSIARKGKKLSVEHSKKISESNRGRVFSDEHKRKISEQRKGIVFSKETRKRMSEANKAYRKRMKEGA